MGRLAARALSVVTQHIGLVATVSTSFNEPYNLARKFASLDHLSGGRSGWNLVTSSTESEAHNCSFEQHPDHAVRYERAREFYDVVAGLWDSWEDDTVLRDKESGVYFDLAKLHVLNHHGKHFKVRGPLNVARAPQGWPVVVQADASEAGKELAAQTAEVQRRGLFRTEYEGRTLRDNLGLPRPQNRYTQLAAKQAQSVAGAR